MGEIQRRVVTYLPSPMASCITERPGEKQRKNEEYRSMEDIGVLACEERGWVTSRILNGGSTPAMISNTCTVQLNSNTPTSTYTTSYQVLPAAPIRVFTNSRPHVTKSPAKTVYRRLSSNRP